MAYRNNGYTVSYWPQRGPPFAMESCNPGYNSYGGYEWNGNYYMNRMEALSYNNRQFGYGIRRSERNQFSHMIPVYGQRLPQRSTVSNPPSKRKSRQRKAVSQARPGNKPSEGKLGKSLPQGGLASEPPSKKTPVQGKRISESSPAGEPPTKKTKVDEAKSKRRNNRRRRFFRSRKNTSGQATKKTSSIKENSKCLPCSVGFNSAEEYGYHLKSESHKTKSAEFHHSEKLTVGFDNDEEAIKPAKVQAKNEGTSEEKQDPDPVGVFAVVKVTGFYCKLCRKFFKDENVAKQKHCSSEMHHEAYKKVKEIALKEEEERQRNAVTQSEAEQLAADIAAVQREARDAARKAAFERRAAKLSEQSEQKKGDGAEVSSLTDDQEKSCDANQEVKDHSNLPEKEQTKVKEEVMDDNTLDENKEKTDVMPEKKDGTLLEDKEQMKMDEEKGQAEIKQEKMDEENEQTEEI